MRHLKELNTFCILAILASSAAAATNKCIDANGQVTYTNTACQSGLETKNVEEKASIVDASAERALIAKEAEQRKAQEAALANSNEIAADIPATGGITAANLAKLKEADSLAHTAIGARERLGLATALLIGIAAIFMFFLRRNKK